MDSTTGTEEFKGKRSRTRERIANAGILLFQQQGFDATTMEQIAVAADVVRGTLYNHFPVKEAIVVYWLHGQLSHALGPLMQDAMRRRSFRTRVTTLLDASAAWWEHHRDFAAPYVRHRFQEIRENEGNEPTSEMIPAYERLILAAQESGELSSRRPAIRLASYLHFLSLYALLDWLGDPRTPLPKRYAESLEFFLEGALARNSEVKSK